MEEDINIIKNHYVFTTNHVLDDENKRFKQAIENLINKYKEQEETNNILSDVIKSLTKLGEEHMEMINLMAIQLAKRKNIMEKVCKECPYCDCIESKTKNCVIDYFKKKAREKNEM